MLRFDYMPSDFHPLFLFIGETADLTALTSLLRQFADSPRDMVVADEIPSAISRSRLVVALATDEFGMRSDGAGFAWKLNAWQASRIADKLDGLTSSGTKSGSETVEVGSDGEIPVKISRGEFTDDFLVTKR